MPRTSASLAKAKGKGKRAKLKKENTPDELASDEDYVEQVEAELEVRRLPQKRPRTSAKSTKVAVRKKQVRGKRSRLAGLVAMPIDIFTEVASYLLPADIISLSRSNKFFRNLLMSRSAIHIWHRSMKNLKGLPPCPTGMSEPHYLSLLFSKTCSICGAPTTADMDAILLVRPCGPCRKAHLMHLDSVPTMLIPWLVLSARTPPSGPRSWEAYVLREEVTDLLAQYEEIKQANDKAALKAWSKARKVIIGARRKQAIEIIQFQNALEWEREKELLDIKEARRSEIKRRLKEMGWSEEDMKFGWRSIHERTWHNLVSQSKPLTDQIWANLRPKLHTLLERNREERMKAERDARKDERKSRLRQLYLDMKEDDPSELKLMARKPVTQFLRRTPRIHFTYRGPFPEFDHILGWPVVKELYETDLTAEEMEAIFEQRRSEIEVLITEWKNRIQTHLVGLLRDGYETKGEVLRPVIAVLNESSLSNVSDDLKLLLRADSLFYKTTSTDSPKKPMTYGTIISTEGLIDWNSTHGAALTQEAPNLDHIRWHPEAHEIARRILADMKRPDISCLEMKAVGAVFVCGRCHDYEYRNWEGMVQHYLEENQRYTQIQDDLSLLAQKGITFNDVHDPNSLGDQPLVTDYASKPSESFVEIDSAGSLLCQVCEVIPTARRVVTSNDVMAKHLLEVHGIAKPKIDKHYVLHDLSDNDSDQSELMRYDRGYYDSNGRWRSDFGDSEAERWRNDPGDMLSEDEYESDEGLFPRDYRF